MAKIPLYQVLTVVNIHGRLCYMERSSVSYKATAPNNIEIMASARGAVGWGSIPNPITQRRKNWQVCASQFGAWH